MQSGNVTLYIRRPQKSGKWSFLRVPEKQLARLKPLEEHEGLYYLSWYEGRKKKFVSVGRTPDEARTAYANRLNGEIVFPKTSPGTSKTTVEDGIEKYFRELKNEAGKDGMGKSESTLSAYEQRLGLFHEFCDDRNIVYLDRITRDDLVCYVEWLRGDRRG